MGAPYSAQIQQALREFLREHPGGDGTGDVVGPGGALDNHVALFDGTTGRLLKDGGVEVTGLPPSSGANKVLFDDGATQDWSNEPRLTRVRFGTTTLVGLGDSDGQVRVGSGTNHTTLQVQNGEEDEVGAIGWSGNTFVVGTKGGVGDGTARDVVIGSAAGAPNGIYFATEDLSRWRVDSDGHLKPFADGVYDIGDAGTRVRKLFLTDLILGTANPLSLQASETLPDRLLVGRPPETGVTVTITPALPTGEASNGSGLDLRGGAGSGGGGVRLLAGTDTSAAGDSTPATIRLVAGYADNSSARGSVVVDSPYLNFNTTAGETGYGLRDNAGTIEAKHSGGAWAALGGGLPAGLDYAADTFTLGVAGAPTNYQTVRPAASIGADQPGTDFILLGGNPTGTGTGGSLRLSGANAVAGDKALVIVQGGQSGGGGNIYLVPGAGEGEGMLAGTVDIENANGDSRLNISNTDVLAAVPITAPDFVVSGSRFKTDTVDGHTAALAAYDVDGAAYVDFIQLTNGNVPTCVVKATDFKASDGASGVDASIVIPAVATITVKNGLITAVV